LGFFFAGALVALLVLLGALPLGTLAGVEEPEETPPTPLEEA
jgi:hypothetical protein